MVTIQPGPGGHAPKGVPPGVATVAAVSPGGRRDVAQTAACGGSPPSGALTQVAVTRYRYRGQQISTPSSGLFFTTPRARFLPRD
jgi:hypothetical protein